MLKDVLIYETSGNGKYLQILDESDVADLSDHLDSKTAMEMITVLMETLKDYKNVTAITPLFEVTLLKLASVQNKPVEMSPLRYETPFRKGPPEEVLKKIEQEEKKVEKPVVQEKPAPVVEKEPEPEPEEQVSLFLDDAVASDDNVLYINGSENEDHYELDDKTLVDIMVTSKKDIKNSLLENWKNLKRLTAHPKLGKIASLLVDGRPLVVSNKVMILEYQSDNVVEKMNLIKNQKDIQNVVRTVFNKKMFVYSVNRKGSVDCQQKYMNLLQLGRLPKADTVNIEFIGD